MKAFEWIDRVKNARGIESDYAAAKALGVTKQAISTYRAKGSTLDENAAISVAKLLGIPPTGVVLDQAAERTKSPEIRATLLAEAAKICGRNVYYVKFKKRLNTLFSVAERKARKKFPLLTDRIACAWVA